MVRGWQESWSGMSAWPFSLMACSVLMLEVLAARHSMAWRHAHLAAVHHMAGHCTPGSSTTYGRALHSKHSTYRQQEADLRQQSSAVPRHAGCKAPFRQLSSSPLVTLCMKSGRGCAPILASAQVMLARCCGLKLPRWCCTTDMNLPEERSAEAQTYHSRRSMDRLVKQNYTCWRLR
jgi:hypothetical protein